MSQRKDGKPMGKYNLEFKLEAVRLVKGGQAVPARRPGYWACRYRRWQLGSAR
jgi:hypothetical protein